MSIRHTRLLKALAAAAGANGLTLPQIRESLPGLSRTAITATLGDLIQHGEIERVRVGVYRVVPPRLPRQLPPLPVGSGFIAPPSRERLMAGR
jgi:predicted transcriptional regulator of viral defense system